VIDELERPPTLAAAAADALKDAILRGDLRPGQPLREGELSASLNVSRGTVREAQRLLQDEGLVEVVPHRGAFVAELSPRTVREMYTLRALLEAYAVRLAMEKDAYREEDFETMETLLRRMGEFEEKGDIFAYIEADLEFHHEICKWSDHGLLLDVLKSVQSLSRLCMINVKLYRTDLEPDGVQHRHIYDAIRTGDPDQAEDAVREHLGFSRIALVAKVAEVQDENGDSENPRLKRPS
jgi:DNA-binding GntR family transcriptional regulator